MLKPFSPQMTPAARMTWQPSLPVSKVLLTAKLLRTVLPALYYASALFAMALHPVVRLSVCHKPEFC